MGKFDMDMQNTPTKNCQYCGAVIPSAAVICTACGCQVQQIRPTKFCQYCGAVIPAEAVICTACGCQVQQMRSETPNIVIQNTNTNSNVNVNGYGRAKNKWVAFFLCLFLGYFGAHKFYEGRIIMGILYLCTCGLCGFGWLVDCIILLLKPNPYFV